MRALVTGGAGFIGSSLATRLADEGHHRPRLYFQTYITQHRARFIRISKRDVSQLDLFFQWRKFAGAGFLFNLCMLVHDFPDVMRSGQRLLHAVLKSRELAHRIVAAKEEEKKCNELRRVHPARDDFLLAKEQ